MELTAGLAVFAFFVACLAGLQHVSPASTVGRWMENEVAAGCLAATVVSGLVLGMLLILYGADAYLHSLLLDAAACAAAFIATIVFLRFFRRAGGQSA